MSDIQQPTADKPAVEDAPAALTTESSVPAASESAPTEPGAAETKLETSATDAPKTGAEASEPKKENVEGEKAKTEAEPVTHGALGYKAPGLMKQLKFSKNYFWFGDEAITQQHMDKFMRGEKPEISYPTTAWASHTGKGLFLFVKHSDQMKTPDGAINLADVSDIAKEGSRDFSLKYHGHKHTFQASNEKERDGWLVAIEKTAEEAKGSKEGILGSDKYKDTISKLNKPATLATGAAAAATAKKSTDAAPADEPTEGRKDSSEAENGKKKSSKSRSVSRGNKRSSLFGSLIGKKEEKEEQKDVKKEEKAEEKAEKKAEKEEKKEEKAAEKEEKKDTKEGEAVAAGTAAAGTAAALDAPATAERATADTPVEDKKTTEATPEKNTAGTGKSTKRGSIFGSFFEKVRSPTSEKKEADVAPVPPPKDDAAPVLPPTDGSDEAPPAPPKDKPEEAAAAGAAAGATAEEAKETKNEKAATPSKEKEGFFKRLLSETKVKVPKPDAAKEESKEGAETTPAEESAKEAETAEGTADKTTEPAAETADKPATEAAAATPTLAEKKDEVTTPRESKRSSIFGTFKSKDKKGDKSDAEKSEGEEKKSNKLGGIFRNPSKAIKSNKETKKEETKPTVDADKEDKKAEQIAANKADPIQAEAVENLKTVDDKANEAKKEQTIGDVVPDAVSVGQPQEQGAPPVQATA